MAPKVQGHAKDLREQGKKNIADDIMLFPLEIFISLRKTLEETQLPSEFVTGTSSK